MVETIGLEPMTPCTSSKCSSQLSYASKYSVVGKREGQTRPEGERSHGESLHSIDMGRRHRLLVETTGLEPVTPCM